MIDRAVIAVACAAAAICFLGMRGCGAAVLAGMLAWMYQDAAVALGGILFVVYVLLNSRARLRAAPTATRTTSVTREPPSDDSDAIDVEFELVKER